MSPSSTIPSRIGKEGRTRYGEAEGSLALLGMTAERKTRETQERTASEGGPYKTKRAARRG
jgi:hypothetical protein